MVLTIADRLSKGCHLISLPNLPSAKEMTELTQHVIRLHGFPQHLLWPWSSVHLFGCLIRVNSRGKVSCCALRSRLLICVWRWSPAYNCIIFTVFSILESHQNYIRAQPWCDTHMTIIPVISPDSNFIKFFKQNLDHISSVNTPTDYIFIGLIVSGRSYTEIQKSKWIVKHFFHINSLYNPVITYCHPFHPLQVFLEVYRFLFF